MRKGCFSAIVVVLVAIAVGVVVAPIWFDRTGTFSHANYERIRPGMTIAEVEQLLGAPGMDVRESELPGVVDWDGPVDHPQRVKAVVAGERYLRWDSPAGYVIVSLRREKVAEKWYWEPDL